MAVGTVSGIVPEDNWQLLTSVTASGTSITFSSLSGYKHIWIVGQAITKNSSAHVAIRPNNDSSAGSYCMSWAGGTETQFLVAPNTSASQASAFRIFNIDKSIPHDIEGEYDPADWIPQAAYVNPVPITSLVVRTHNGTTSFTGGTFYVYGIPA